MKWINPVYIMTLFSYWHFLPAETKIAGKWPEMDNSSLKNVSVWLLEGGLFCQLKVNLLEIA